MSDSEMGEIFGAWREQKREKKAGNRESSTAILKSNGVEFESKNDGAHLIVRHAGVVADFWPSTGKYAIRGSGRYQRGVFRLLRDLGVDRTGAQS